VPSLSAEKRMDLVQATKGAAAAFLEDMQYLREVSVRIQTSRGELRRLSAVLRRLVVENEIARIASPRIGRINFHATDLKPFYSLFKNTNILFFSGSSAYVFGVDVMPFLMVNLGQVPIGSSPEDYIRQRIGSFDKLNRFSTTSLRAGNFVAQKVICYSRQWVSRGAIITYVANFMSGVHSGTPIQHEELLMERIRGACIYGIEGGDLRIHVLPELGRDSAPLTLASSRGKLDFDAASLDPLLVEVLATARLLVESPDIATLEGVLSAELGK
jgi:hypothetical protein